MGDFMRISKRLIRRVADSLLEEKERITQHEVHKEISKILQRQLTPAEKRRVTLVIRHNYRFVERRKDERNIRVDFYEIY